MNDLERDVLQLIGENVDSPDVFTDDDAGMEPVRDSLNDAIEEIAMLTGAVKASYPLLLRAGQTFYEMDFRGARFGWVTDAWLSSVQRRLEQTDVARLNSFNARWLVNTGTPQAYGQLDTDIVFVWPKPSADLVLDLTCVIIPARYAADTDRVRLREAFKIAAVQYAVGEYWASRGDAQQAKEYHARYLEGLGIAGFYAEAFERRPFLRTEKAPVGVT